MNAIQVKQINGTFYKSKQVEVMGNSFLILEATGKQNYVNIMKVTNNPFLTGGKFFKTWDEACMNYKSADMKYEILMAEMEFKNS